MESICELCWKCAAIIIFCMALTLGINQQYQIHVCMEKWKNASQLEQDVQPYKGEEWIV